MQKKINHVLRVAALALAPVFVSAQTPPAIPVAPDAPACNAGISFVEGNYNQPVIVNYQGTGALGGNINMSGGTVVVCGNLTINAGNFGYHSGQPTRFFVMPGGTLTFGNSFQSVNFDIINYGTVEFKANGMNINGNNIIWNFNQLTFTGNNTHHINGIIITSNGGTTTFDKNVLINGSGIFHVDEYSFMNIGGSISSDGKIVLWANSTINILGAYGSNSGAVIFLDDYAIMHIHGSANFQHKIYYFGDDNVGGMVKIDGAVNFGVPASPHEQVFICYVPTLTPQELENAQQSCVANTTVPPTPYSEFGPIGLDPLPVTMVEFTAERIPQGALISWRTASEINNAFFRIQRSSDMNVWDDVDLVEGLGTSSVGKSYSFVDPNPQTYYRIIQVDYDGKFEMFGPVSIGNTLKFDELSVELVNGYFRIQAPGNFDYVLTSVSGQAYNAGNGADGVLVPADMHGFVLVQLKTAWENRSYKFFLP